MGAFRRSYCELLKYKAGYNSRGLKHRFHPTKPKKNKRARAIKTSKMRITEKQEQTFLMHPVMTRRRRQCSRSVTVQTALKRCEVTVFELNLAVAECSGLGIAKIKMEE
ncbi:hypothetical protein AVEN_246557-1 [Araneus ventricosus]|uniref:Uncharacterized protein n=1 Tax=Araneus ventricosus TaxID=182803 RepID=A0A4Y2DE40_ARAVE|nr:hypothetical protein AVEN_246557-1 [Araneus ventricosus]